MPTRQRSHCLMLLVVGLLANATVCAAPGQPELVSRAMIATRMPSDGASQNAAASASLQYHVFDSWAENLLPTDTNQRRDVFLFDTAVGIQLLSRTPLAEANGDSSHPDISPDGAFIVFSSEASNLVAGDTNGLADIFVRERATGTIQRLNVPNTEPNGVSRTPRISADGRYVAFVSAASNWVAGDTNGIDDVFLFDRQAQSVQRVSVASGGAEVTDLPTLNPQISADGRCVSYDSSSAQLVADDTNDRVDHFIHDTLDQSTRRASVGSLGQQISGGYEGSAALVGCDALVFYTLDASTIPGSGTRGLFLRQGGTTTFLPATGWTGNGPLKLVLSANRRYLGIGTDAYQLNAHAFEVFDLQDRVSVHVSGKFGLPRGLSNDGTRWVAETVRSLVPFDRNALADLVIRDRNSAAEWWISASYASSPLTMESNGSSGFGSGIYHTSQTLLTRRHHALSSDGRFVLFSSLASNLIAGDTNQVEDVFLFDRQLGTMQRVSEGEGGVEQFAASGAADLSGDGRVAVFESCAAFGIPENGLVCDVFARDLESGVVSKVTIGPGGVEANRGGVSSTGHWPRISDDGRFIVFRSQADNLVPGTSGPITRIYLRDRELGTTQLLGSGLRSSISRNGQFVVWTTSNTVVVHDRLTQQTNELVLVPGGGTINGSLDWPSISDSGRYIAFMSDAPDLVADDDDSSLFDVFVHDRQTGFTQLISRDTGTSAGSTVGISPEISPDGEWVAYLPIRSGAALAGETQVIDSRGIVVHREFGERRAFVDESMVIQGRDLMSRPRFSSDSRTLVFGANSLSRLALDQNGDIADVYATEVEPIRLFRDGFE